jgi:hypothetical protein
MNVNQDLIGKTITGVIATGDRRAAAREIWMLQFSDGTHVEFVSPGARKALRRSVHRPSLLSQSTACDSSQLQLIAG